MPGFKHENESQLIDYARRMRKRAEAGEALLREVAEFFDGDVHEPFESKRMGGTVCRSDEAEWPCLVERLRRFVEAAS